MTNDLEQVVRHTQQPLALNLEQAAVALGYSLATIRRAITTGNLVPRYANSKPVLLVSELEEWLVNLPTRSPRGH